MVVLVAKAGMLFARPIHNSHHHRPCIALYPVNHSAIVQSTWRIVRSRRELSTTLTAIFFLAVIAFFSLSIYWATYTFYSHGRRAMMELG